MQKLDGHWVAKRIGILEHYKGMTLSEIVLFDAYLLLANKQTWECWRTVRQLEEILPMKRHTIINAKRSLADKGWIRKINQTGVFIPKLYRYSDDTVQNGQHSSNLDNGQKVHLGQQKELDGQQPVQNGQQQVPFGITIIEDDIIEDSNISISPNADAPSPPETVIPPSADENKDLNYHSKLRSGIKNSTKQKEKEDGIHSICGSRSNNHGTWSGRKGFDLPSDYPIDTGGINDGED